MTGRIRKKEGVKGSRGGIYNTGGTIYQRGGAREDLVIDLGANVHLTTLTGTFYPLQMSLHRCLFMNDIQYKPIERPFDLVCGRPVL